MHCAVLGLFSLRLLETITRYVCKQTDNIFTDQTRMLVKNLTLLSTKCSLLRCIRESWRSNHVRPFSVSVEPATEFFQLSSGDKLAYKKTSGSRHPGVMFMPGLLANMTGEKARILEQYCSIHNHPFIRFDYRGIGESSGDLQSFTTVDWLNDALTVLDTLTGPGEPQIIVGSSMGALMALHVAIRRPEKVFGVVGIALPINYIAKMASLLTDEMKAFLKQGGSIPSGMGNFSYSQKFLDDGSTLAFHPDEKIKLACPVRLLHGCKDDVVPWESSPTLLSSLESNDVQIILSKSADHRFSEPRDLQLLVNTVDQLLKQYEFF